MSHYILIKDNCKYNYMCWAERFIYVYSIYNGYHFTFPHGNKIEIIKHQDGMVLKIDLTLESTHPHIIKHAIELGHILNHEIEELYWPVV